MKFCYRAILLFILMLLGLSQKVVEPSNYRILDNTNEENGINEDWEPLRVQYKLAQIKIENEYQEFFEKLFSVASTFLTRYFLVQRLTKAIKIANQEYFKNENISTQYLDESFETDLLIFVQIYMNNKEIVKAQSYYFQTSPKTNRPTAGIIKWNIYYTNLEKMTDSEFELNMQRLIATSMFIMGFAPKAFPNYFDSSNNQNYSNTSTTINGINYLSTPRVKKVIKQYFKCDSFYGAQLENDGGTNYENHHLERSIFYNEILTSASMEGNMIISDLTFQIFQDTGFYNLMEYSPDKALWGKGMGCEFLQKKCKGDFQEFCKNENEEGCSFLNTGQSTCQQDDFSDQCKYFQIKQDYDCRDSSSGGNVNSETFQHFGSDSMCVVGSISENENAANQQKISCLQYQCDANNQLTLIINSKSYNCLSNKTIKIDNDYFGQISCPQDPENFCKSQDECQDQCNQRGYCLNKICICQQGYSGKGCEINCSHYRYIYQCYDQCPQNTYPIESIKYCVGCPGNCQTCSNYNNCITCYTGYQKNNIGFCDIIYNGEVSESEESGEEDENKEPVEEVQDEQYSTLIFTYNKDNAHLIGASLAILILF